MSVLTHILKITLAVEGARGPPVMQTMTFLPLFANAIIGMIENT